MSGPGGPFAGTGAALSWNPISDVGQLLRFHFMVNSLQAGTIAAALAAVLGWMMILRRQSFVGHTLAVVAFPGASGAVLLGLSPALGYFGFPVVAALVIGTSAREAGLSEQTAVIGTVQAFALACGFLFASLYRGLLNGVTGLLFGSFLGVSDTEVTVLLVVAASTVAILAVIGRPLWFASVDPMIAGARGVPVRALSAIFVVLLGVAVAEVAQITGALLVFALLVMPAAAAQQLCVRPAPSLALTVAIAVAVTWLGLGIAYFSVYPVGFFLTTVGFAAYLVAVAARRLVDRRGRRAPTRRRAGA